MLLRDPALTLFVFEPNLSPPFLIYKFQPDAPEMGHN